MSASGVTSKPALPQDLPWLIQLRMVTMSDYLAKSGERLVYADHQARVLQDFGHIEILLLNQQPIGMYKLIRAAQQWALVQIQIAPTHQRTGIGSTLLQTIIDQADAAGATLSLSVLKVNPAQQLYKRLGFRVVQDKIHSVAMQRLPMTPLRIHITGNAGSGKTTLAVALGKQLELPVHHLDSIVWQPHWKKTPMAKRQRLEAALCDPKTWIIEGVSEQIRQRADRVLILDTPVWQCLWRAGKRNLPYAFRSRPGLPAHCPEILIVPRLLRIITRFNSTIRQDLVRESSTATKYRWLPANSTTDEAIQQLR